MDSLLPYFDSPLIFLFAILVIFFCYYNLIRKPSTHKPKLAPPQPGGSWPLLGHLPLLSGSDPPHLTLATLADKCGSIFTIKFGLQHVLVLNNSELAKELFTFNDLTVTSRPALAAAKFMGYNYAFFPFTPTGGTYWRETRKLSTVELLSNRRLELLKHIRIQEVENSIKELFELSISTEKKSVDLKRWFSDLNHNVLMRMVIGKKYFGEGAAGDEEEGRRFQKALLVLFHYLGTPVLRDAVPFLGWLDFGGHEKIMKRTAKELDSFLEKMLQEHKMKRFMSEKEGEKDFMDAMISVLGDKTLEGVDADTVNKAACLTLISGNETITVAMVWAISLLLNNKQALKKAQEELDKHVGRERLVNEADISNLVYIQAIFKETLRLYPPALIPGPRQFTQDCTIGGYNIRKGTWLMLNLWKIHRDPSVWWDPMEYKPERFLSTHKNVDVRGKQFELLPFGGGRRACPAVSLGLHMAHLTLASLLQAFDISTLDNEDVDMTPSVGLTNMKVTPLDIVVSPRLPPSCFK